MATRRIILSRRLFPVVGIMTVGALMFPAGAAIASPAKPSRAELQKKLDQLDAKADHIVDQYDGAKVDFQNSRKAYRKLNAAAKKDAKIVSRMRGKIAMMSSAAYQDGNLTAPASMFASGNPQGVLDKLASLDHLSSSQTAAIAAFLNSDARLRSERNKAKSKYDDARKSFKKVSSRKADIEKLIKKQKKLISQLPPPPSAGGPGAYNGPASGSARAALNYAFAQLGKPYVYGGTGPDGYDCSGLTMMSWKAGGVSLPRTSQAQYNAGPHVSQSALQPGDLVFFNGLDHVGMWIGNGEIIHAPHTGDVVRKEEFANMASSYVGAVRP